MAGKNQVLKDAQAYFESDNDDDEQESRALSTINAPVENVEIDEYADLFAGLGSDEGEKVLLYRLVPGSRKQAIVCRLEPGTSAEDIPMRFGGGDYIIKRIKSGMIMKSAQLFVEGEPIIEKPKPKEEPAANNAQSPQAIEALVSALREENRIFSANIIQALQGSQTSRRDMLEEMQVMRNIFMPANQAPQADPMTMLLKGIELARELTPRGDGQTSGMDVLAEAVRSFAPAIGSITQQLQANQAAAAMPINAQAALPAAPVQPQQTQEDQMMMLKIYLNMMVSNAKAGKDPVLYADLVLDNLTDAQLNELMATPDLLDRLAAMNPDVLTYRPWFEKLIYEIKDALGLTGASLSGSVAPINSIPAGSNATSAITGNPDPNAAIADQ